MSKQFFLIGILISFFTACGSESGTVKLFLTDAPLTGVTAVNVTISSVEIHQPSDEDEGGWQTIAEEEQTFDLLTLRDGVRAGLGDIELPEGKITQVRLHLSESELPTVEDADGIHEMVIPSGNNTGIKLTGCFLVEPEQDTEITLDFDAEASVSVTGSGEYKMSPTIKIVEKSNCKDDDSKNGD